RYRVSGSRDPFFDTPGRPVVVQQFEERGRLERLRAEHTRARPRAVPEKLQRHDPVDGRLPHDGLPAIAAPGLLLVPHVIEVDLPGVSVRARPRDAGPGAR